MRGVKYAIVALVASAGSAMATIPASAANDVPGGGGGTFYGCPYLSPGESALIAEMPTENQAVAAIQYCQQRNMEYTQYVSNIQYTYNNIVTAIVRNDR